jgi:aspartate/methionine/tyrosine aminotransferase
MKLEPFVMERMQSTWENRVDYNLSESGVHPVPLRDLLEMNGTDMTELLGHEIGYVQSNGTIELREKIAAMYSGATAEHILVCTGTAEANFLAVWSLVEPGDEVALMLPNYMQIWGIARGFGATVRPFHLREEDGWAPDLDELRRVVSARTRLIAVCNPNNPTGAILTEDQMRQITSIASKFGTWLLVDEVYQGAERDCGRTPTFWGLYERLLITAGLSKAYGLPGLRIGWMACPPEIAASCWSYKDYTTIGPGALNEKLARLALNPSTREKILHRTQSILRNNYPVLAGWMSAHPGIFSLVEPHAGAIALLRYRLNINSTRLAEKLLHERSVLIVPGDHFGMDRFLRLGYGPPEAYLRAALDRVHATLAELEQSPKPQR